MMIVTAENRTAEMVQLNFSERLAESAQARNSLLCVGLDPRERDVESTRDACFRLIDATADYAAAFKANSAFFEAFGAEGFDALRQVIARVPEGVPVILDAKRGDIADTAEAYARSAYDHLGADGITANPYFGGEALAPFLERPERGVFILCKTSNPGADEFQALQVDGHTLFELVAERAREWNTRGNVGLVVGATDPAAVARVRELAPELWLLVPGVGAQGGDLRATLKAGLRPDGMGVLITVSRALARAADPAVEARRLRDEINALRVNLGPADPHAEANWGVRTLARDLIASGCVRFGEFKLKSGILSPIYLDLRRLVSYPQILRRVARAYADRLAQLHFDRLAGIPYAGLPIAAAIALEMERPLIYPRREAKAYGTGVEIEGEHEPGETAVVIDDLATTGGTKIESIQKLEAAGLVARDIVVLIDREQGAQAALAEAGYQLHAVVTLRQLLAEWKRTGSITPEQFAHVTRFLEEGS